MKNRILLIGGVGAGKTSLKQRLLSQTLIYQKTQVLEFSNLFIDCPGEYLELPRYYHVLIDASHRVSEVWALQDATRRRSFFPPNFAHVFKKPVVGIITKIDREDACLPMAEGFLKLAGFSHTLYRVSASNGAGIPALAARLGELHNGC